MRRVVILSLSIIATILVFGQARQRAARGTLTTETVAQNPGAPLLGLSDVELAAFNAGRGAFGRNATVAGDLGPVFNDDSCGACHNGAAPGGGSPRTVTRFATRTGGLYDPLASLGGSLQQVRAIGPRNGSTHAFAPET